MDRISLGTLIIATALIPVSALAQSAAFDCARWETFDRVTQIAIESNERDSQVRFGVQGRAFLTLPEDPETAAAVIREAADAMARYVLNPEEGGEINICFPESGQRSRALKAASAKP